MDITREFTFHAAFGEIVQVGGGPSGSRSVGELREGWAKGERINGRLVGPAADWAVVGTDGYAQVDVRAQIRTDDGADLYIQYCGSLELNDAARAALFSDTETSFGDNYWVMHIRLECGAEAYRWVNRTMFVGYGRATTDGVEYEVFRLS